MGKGEHTFQQTQEQEIKTKSKCMARVNSKILIFLSKTYEILSGYSHSMYIELTK